MSSTGASIHRGIQEVFDVELSYTRSEVRENPPETPASEYMSTLETMDEIEKIAEIESAAEEISVLMSFSQVTSGGKYLGILDIFSATQILEMQGRLHDYLGMSVDEHLDHPEAPKGYPNYIGRLATYFIYSDDEITTQFGSFVDRHIDPVLPNATGPHERNSRQYAVWANNELLRQLKEFYQYDIDIEPRGPIKDVQGTLGCWERGVAECHFILLDYIRDQVAITARSPVQPGEQLTMGLSDIEQNLVNLTLNRKRIVREVQQLNPVLARQIDNTLDSLPEHMVDVFHRGRMGVPRFHKYPDNARRALERVEALLDSAVILSRNAEHQEEVPILDLE